MKTSSNKNETTVAARISGEDIKKGDFVSLLNEVIELPSYLWCCSADSLTPEEPVQFRYKARDAGKPLKVVSICLPFVYAMNNEKRLLTIDTRSKQLVRLDRKCARKVWKKLKR